MSEACTSEYNYTAFDYYYLPSLLCSFANGRIQHQKEDKGNWITYFPRVRDEVELKETWSTVHFSDNVAKTSLVAMEVHSLYFSKPDGWIEFINKARSWLLEKQTPYGYWFDGANSPDYTTVLVLDALELTKGGKGISFTTSPITLPDEKPKSEDKQEQDEDCTAPVVPYVEVDYETRTLIVGTKSIVLEGKLWDFVCKLLVSQSYGYPLGRQEGEVNWKNAYDMLRRKLGSSELLSRFVSSVRDGYRLTGHIKVKGRSSVGIRPSYQRTVSLDSVEELADDRYNPERLASD